MSDNINNAQVLCGYLFAGNPEALAMALRAPGSSHLAGPEGNKPLASLGDRVMQVYFAERGLDEGWSVAQTTDRIRNAANNARLSAICETSGLVDCIAVHHGQFGPLGARTKADTVEAVIGAAYVSGGMPAAEVVMRNLGVI